MKKQALGRGLSALIDTDIKPDGGSSINEIEISKIHPNPNQPRTYFDEEALQELANSIHEMGIVSPITLRQLDDDTYQIIAGERRYRASKLAGLDKIPAYIKTNQDEQHVQLMALIENSSISAPLLTWLSMALKQASTGPLPRAQTLTSCPWC